MPVTLEAMVYYFFGSVLLISIVGYFALNYYAERARRQQKHAEARLKRQEDVLHAVKSDLSRVRHSMKGKVGVQQAETRISKAISDLLTVEVEERVPARR